MLLLLWISIISSNHTDHLLLLRIGGALGRSNILLLLLLWVRGRTTWSSELVLLVGLLLCLLLHVVHVLLLKLLLLVNIGCSVHVTVLLLLLMSGLLALRLSLATSSGVGYLLSLPSLLDSGDILMSLLHG